MMIIKTLTKRMRMLAFAVLALGIGQAHSATLYSTGFESPTFTTGTIAGQDGWAVFGNPGTSQVETGTVNAGTQAVGVIPALASGQEGFYLTVNTAASIVRQSADIYLFSSSTQSEWQFAALGAGLTPFAGGIDIYPDDSIHLITNGFASVGTWNRNQWVHVDLTLNYATQTFDLALDSVVVASNVAFCGDNGPCLGAPVAGGYANGLFDVFAGDPNLNDLGILDNYSVSSMAAVPEPETYAMLLAGLGLLGWIGRRRKQNLA